MTIEELYDLFDDNYTVLNTHGHYTDTDECKAVEMVLDVIKELQAHREAWEKVLDEMMNASIPGQDAEYVYENIYDIIKKYRPKEGDAE